MHEKLYESIFIKLELKKETFTCGTIYRSPNYNKEFNQFFINELKKAFGHIKSGDKCFIFGDFNYNLLQTDNINTQNFLDTMYDNSFYLLINQPTRITDTTATILDHIWTNLYSKNIKSSILVHPISDHLPTLMCCYSSETKYKPVHKV